MPSEPSAIAADELMRLAAEGAARALPLPRLVERARHDAEALGAEPVEWEDPLDLFREIAARPFRPEDVPRIVGEYAAALSRATGFCASATILPMVTAAAAAVDDRVRLLVAPRSSWFESARIWSLVLGGPAAGKTPALRAALKPLQHAAAAMHAAWLAENPAPKDDGGTTPAPRLLTHDATIEALADVLRDNPRGILCVAEEFDSWIGSHDCYRGGQGSRDRGEWLRLYDGGPSTIDRVRRGAMYVPNWGASIAASTTPAALKRHAKNLPTDGLLQRFMPAIVGRRAKPDRAMLQAELARPCAEFEDRIRALIERHGGQAGESGAVVRMSGDAREVFEAEEQALLEATDATEQLSPAFAAHIGKHPAMLARVALTFHAMQASGHPADAELSGATMSLAARFMRRVRRHASTLYGVLYEHRNDAAAIARALARSLLASRLESLNKRAALAICRDFRGADARTQEAALQALADCGWLRPEFLSIIPPHGAIWTVNPLALERFRAVGEEHAARRAMVRELLTGGDDDRPEERGDG